MPHDIKQGKLLPSVWVATDDIWKHLQVLNIENHKTFPRSVAAKMVVPQTATFIGHMMIQWIPWITIDESRSQPIVPSCPESSWRVLQTASIPPRNAGPNLLQLSPFATRFQCWTKTDNGDNGTVPKYSTMLHYFCSATARIDSWNRMLWWRCSISSAHAMTQYTQWRCGGSPEVWLGVTRCETARRSTFAARFKLASAPPSCNIASVPRALSQDCDNTLL